MISVSEKDKMLENRNQHYEEQVAGNFDNNNYRRTPVCEIEHVNFAIKVMRDDLWSCVTRGRERSADNEQVTQENKKKCRRRRRKIHRLITNKKAEADAKSKEAEVPDETPNHKTRERD